MVVRHLDNKNLITWSHEPIAKAMKKRYVHQTDDIVQTHKTIAQLFLETWIDNKPLVCKERNINISEGGDRLLCVQPLLYSDTKYNNRRISELWFHLLNAGIYVDI